MTAEQQQQLIIDVKNYVTENLPLNSISDEELQEKVEEIVAQKIGSAYCPIDQRVSVVEQVYSSIRGFGLLDSIIKDDTITEVMINGPDNIFIEQNGRLFKLDKQFESQRRLEDVIQRIVGLAGREVNEDEDENCIEVVRNLKEQLSDMPDALLWFDSEIFRQLISKVYVISKDTMAFELKCGMKLKERIAWD